MAYIIVNSDVLEAVCGWAITEGDENKDLTITWQYQGPVTVTVVASNGDTVEMNDYQIDRSIFLTEDLPALKLSNEIEEENYAL